MIRHHNRLARAAALTLALTAMATSPALAMPPRHSPGPCSEVCSGGGYTPGPSRPAATPASAGPGSDVASTNGHGSRVSPTVVRISSGDSGFDWGDAGIGAGAALGLTLAATGGMLLLAHRRTQSRAAS